MIDLVELSRDRIQFESMGGSCACGNGDQHQRDAMAAWADSAEALAQDAHGLRLTATVRSGNDHRRRAYYITEGRQEEDGRVWCEPRLHGGKPHCITAGHYDDVPPAEVLAAVAAIEAADAAGMEAAHKASHCAE